ncbi:MAG: threonylcarbamoyl-AMP synthase [Candidatus Pacebacteria bacterium]|nr:threonylcarbamoyl-AMP synthase [Candidatus Paceibacterota bacterium]MCD8508351.1 threonylcarbamoyl-AMP synthase [Candidatus Paceibacterota bacterium]MCD8528103.1 threonylcarbamoyl-AMP synthase [Candidatus Paceibacterota bacterium]MCD8563624.1 threonylcarbamoyl-AMP synthase [Candidatus Paceibacterota bacterium]
MFSPLDAKILRQGGIGILPTDTLYGIVASVFHSDAIARVYELKGRTPTKPCIILIADITDLDQFPIDLNSFQKDFLRKHWPAPLSVILDLNQDLFADIHRGTLSLAFRIPKDEHLREFLRISGPLIAPSANREGETPAATCDEARHYFPRGIDVYSDGGVIHNTEPSTIIHLHDDGYTLVRQGAYTIGSL